jgi:hypothetical protein
MASLDANYRQGGRYRRVRRLAGCVCYPTSKDEYLRYHQA